MYTFAQFVEKKLQEQQAPLAQPAKPGAPAAPATAAQPGTPQATATNQPAAKPGAPAAPPLNPATKQKMTGELGQAVNTILAKYGIK